MNKGKVKFFNAARGYGFIIYDGQEVFAHYSQIQGEGFKTLHEGQEVEFDLYEGSKGLEARNIIRK